MILQNMLRIDVGKIIHKTKYFIAQFKVLGYGL